MFLINRKRKRAQKKVATQVRRKTMELRQSKRGVRIDQLMRKPNTTGGDSPIPLRQERTRRKASILANRSKKNDDEQITISMAPDNK